LQENLDAADIDHLLDLAEDFVFVQRVALAAFGRVVERAELALHPADVGVVDVAPGDVGHDAARVLALPHEVGQHAQLG
jgi:hypothetical protein